MVKLSPKIKFVAITVDELLLVPLFIILAYYFIPELLLFTIVVSITGAIIFVAVKYHLVYDALQDGSYYLYEMSGIKCKAIEDITKHSGKVRIGQEIWLARSHLDDISSGTEVIVVSRDQMKVIVRPLEEVNL